MSNKWGPLQMYIEGVAFQQSMIDFVMYKEIPVEGFLPGGHDKRARFITISEFIKSGRVVFPKHGAEQLIEQMVWFGSARHDDLLDALMILVLKISKRENEGRIIMLPPLVMPETPDDASLKQNDLWREDQRIAFHQGRLPPHMWYAAEDEYLKRKREILKEIQQRQLRQRNEDINRGTKEHLRQEHKRLMAPRIGR